jgi:archaellum component FlaC
MITKEQLETILGTNIANFDELTTAIKSYIDTKDIELSKIIEAGDKKILDQLNLDGKDLQKIKDLLDLLDGAGDGELNIPDTLAGLQGSITSIKESLAGLVTRVDDLVAKYTDILNRVVTLENDNSTNKELWNKLYTGLVNFADTIKTSTSKFAITTDNTSSDDNVL